MDAKYGTHAKCKVMLSVVPKSLRQKFFCLINGLRRAWGGGGGGGGRGEEGKGTYN